jgi:hypothetical protein
MVVFQRRANANHDVFIKGAGHGSSYGTVARLNVAHLAAGVSRKSGRRRRRPELGSPSMGGYSEAHVRLGRIKMLVDRAGIRYITLAETSWSLGVAVAWGETDIIVVSIPTGTPHYAYFTQGLLKNVVQDRLAALEGANNRTCENPEFPVFLHDADNGWDILLQQTYPVQLLTEVPAFFESRLQTTEVAASIRAELQPSLGGTPYRFEDTDLARLLMRAHF